MHLYVQTPFWSAVVAESTVMQHYRGCILGRNWDKNLKTFAPCYSKSPMVLLDLIFLQQQLKVGVGLASFTLSLCLSLKVVLFFLAVYLIDM
jgi:hypothetical protein